MTPPVAFSSNAAAHAADSACSTTSEASAADRSTSAPSIAVAVNTGSRTRPGSSDKVFEAKVMLVDDEPINIKVIEKYLRDAGYRHFVKTTDATTAVDLVRQELPDVVVLDIMMPQVSGLDILQVLRSESAFLHLPVLILTASSDEQIRLKALQLGATDFLNKPIKPAELTPRLRNAVIIKMHHDHVLDYSARLEREVQQRTAELERSRRELIQVLACAAEYRDQETGNHVVRVGRYAGITARRLGLTPEEVDSIEQAAILHDVGKIGITDAVLLKPGKLSERELEVIRNHCEYGANILRGIPSNADGDQMRSLVGLKRSQSPILQLAAVIAATHHERWDGTGYPQGLAGEEIPITGRITAIADVFDALHSRRPYKEPYTLDRCFEIIEESSGSHFDPRVVEAFLDCRDEIRQVARELSDEVV